MKPELTQAVMKGQFGNADVYFLVYACILRKHGEYDSHRNLVEYFQHFCGYIYEPYRKVWYVLAHMRITNHQAFLIGCGDTGIQQEAALFEWNGGKRSGVPAHMAEILST